MVVNVSVNGNFFFFVRNGFKNNDGFASQRAGIKRKGKMIILTATESNTAAYPLLLFFFVTSAPVTQDSDSDKMGRK